jgi:hypothetical protein
MYSFFVLGMVPGTNIQITFDGLIKGFGLFICLLGLRYLVHNKRVRALARQTVSEPAQRAILHASQLHLRVI